ncbi:MAG: hypothetical protein P8L44_08940 [Opitutales bacterium]|jgi:hypothetical protein|nr:hypothetical protein [Opitutales bacterium]
MRAIQFSIISLLLFSTLLHAEEKELIHAKESRIVSLEEAKLNKGDYGYFKIHTRGETAMTEKSF